MLKTAEGKWVLFDVATGAQKEFWPIDARALIEVGSHTAEPPEGATVVEPPQPPKHAGVPQAAVAQTFVGPDGESPPAARSVAAAEPKPRAKARE